MPRPFEEHAFTKAFSLFLKTSCLERGPESIARASSVLCDCDADLSITVTLTYLRAYSVSTDKLVRSIIPNLAPWLAALVTITQTENKARFLTTPLADNGFQCNLYLRFEIRWNTLQVYTAIIYQIPEYVFLLNVQQENPSSLRKLSVLFRSIEYDVAQWRLNLSKKYIWQHNGLGNNTKRL